MQPWHNGEAGRGQQQGVSIGCGLRGKGSADDAACAGAVFDDKGFAELLGQLR